MQNKVKLLVLMVLIGIIAIPSLSSAVSSISIDMDPSTPGIQSEIAASAGDTIITDIIFSLGAGDIMSSFSYSILYDSSELSAPVAGDITENVFASGWGTLGFVLDDPYIRRIGQLYNSNSSTGLIETVITSIVWNVHTPLDDGFFDITPMLSFGDGIFDGNLEPLSVQFYGGAVVPEPVSTALFLTGGAMFGARCFLRRRHQV